MKLTPEEQREVVALVEAGKPLPDKYRFLLFEANREVELVWNGKTNEVTNLVLPFQTIEVVDEPRSGKAGAKASAKDQISFFDERGRQKEGWTNKLIWGDNKLILSSLKNGPLRDEIEAQGGIKLIYIDPPFDVGADFSMDVEVGDETLTKEPNVLEALAYSDTWGKGADSFIAMIYERLALMRDLLAEDGSIYVHLDYRVIHFVRLVLDQLFGKENFTNEIIWKRSLPHNDPKRYGAIHDTLLYYRKSQTFVFNQQFTGLDESYISSHYNQLDENGKKYQLTSLSATGSGPSRRFGKKVLEPPRGNHWRYSQEKIDELVGQGLIVFTSTGSPRFKRYLETSKGPALQTIWDDIQPVNSQALERNNYPTQKPESLLERIINSSSNANDLIADFFCGSGTTAAVAEKLGRKWIATDLGKFAIHTTRKRMLGVQRQLKEEGKDFRAFEVLNLGKYERAHYVAVNPDLRDEERQAQILQKEKDFLKLILSAYKAQEVTGFRCFHGKKAGRVVAVGPINLPVTRLFVEELVLECREKGVSKVDILAFEYEMDLSPNVQEEVKNKGIDLCLKCIPRDIFDKRSVEAGQVEFHDTAYVEVKAHMKPGKIAVELTDFSVFYSQDGGKAVEEELKEGKSKVVVRQGQVMKISKDKNGIIKAAVLTRKWSDWIDYWSVDFDFESKREIIRVKNEVTGKTEERFTGDFIFENEWQSFRTKQDRGLELKTPFHDCAKGKRLKVAVKVVDIFGNDTMKIIEVST